MSTPPDNQVATLQAEIRRAGGLTSRLRKSGAVVGTVAAPAMLLAGLLALAGLGGLVVMVPALGIMGLFGLVVGLFVGVPVSVALLRQHRRLLRDRLAVLPREQQLAVLLPLEDARGDTRRLVAPLLRELRASNELTPAAAPAGHGNEASPSS
jgi:hypothetical protein